MIFWKYEKAKLHCVKFLSTMGPKQWVEYNECGLRWSEQPNLLPGDVASSYPSAFFSNKFSPAFRVSCALLTWSKKVSYLLSFDSPPGWQWCHQWRPGHIPRSSCICWQTLTGKQKNTDIQPFIQLSLLSIHRPSIHPFFHSGHSKASTCVARVVLHTLVNMGFM